MLTLYTMKWMAAAVAGLSGLAIAGLTGSHAQSGLNCLSNVSKWRQAKC